MMTALAVLLAMLGAGMIVELPIGSLLFFAAAWWVGGQASRDGEARMMGLLFVAAVAAVILGFFGVY